MKRITTLLIVVFFFFSLSAQLVVKGNHQSITENIEINKIILFERIDNNSEIHFKAQHAETDVKWFSYQNGVKAKLTNFSVLSPTETYIDPEPNKGYIIQADGKEIVIWIGKRDSKNPIHYQNIAGEIKIYTPQNGVYQKPQSTQKNNLIGDENRPNEAIGCKISTKTTERDATNENQRPTATSLDGSAPMEVEFFSNPVGNPTNFEWFFYKDGELFLSKQDENYTHTFSESGKYKVKIEVRKESELASDSIEISVSESAIAVPKIFTPNGDGFNDEFRVAYTSLAEFDCTILNRWGRIVYRFSNPQKGWDGTINGKQAAEGTYFYIIRAKGSDGKAYQLKGHINLLR